MKTKKFLKQALTLLLTLLMLLSTTSLGLSAAQVELASTGATVTYTAGEYIYLKNFVPSGWGSTTWILSNSYAWAHMWGGTAGTQDYLFELYSGTAGASGAIYRAKVTTGGTYTNVIFTRNSTNSGPWNDKWNQTGDIVLSSSNYNCWTGFTSGGTGKEGSHYPVAPSGVTAVATGVNGGSGTSSDPYLVAPGAEFTITLTGTKADPGMEGFGWNINSTSSKAASTTEETWSQTQTAPATAGTTSTYTGYAWNYEYSTSYYSSSYATSNTIYVKTVANNYSFTASAGEGGSVSPTSGTVTAGESVSLTATPDTGYTFDEWTFTNGTGTTTATTTFTPSADGATAHATFKRIPCTVTVDNVTGGTVTVTGDGPYYYNDEVTLKATPDYANSYAFTGWTITGDYSIVSGSLSTEEIKIKITGNVTATPSYLQTITHSVSASANISGAGEVTPTSQPVADGSSITLKAKANAGYRFTGWTITSGSYTVVTGTTADAEFTIKPTSDVIAVANFVETYTVVFKDWDGDTLDTQTVDKGESATAPANPTREHYTFKEWDTDFSNVTENLTVTAVYEGNTYTVNVSAGTGGTASTTAESVKYPNSVTLTADPDDGYALVNWTITGDYEVVDGYSVNDTTLVLIPKGNITANATFAQGRKLTVYSYSADGYTDLTLTADGTNNVINNVPQTATDEFGTGWYTSAKTDIPLTAETLTAQLSSSGSGNPLDSSTWHKYENDVHKFLVADGYRTIVCTNNNGWSDMYAHIWGSSDYATWPGTKMTYAYTNNQNQDVYVIVFPDDYYNIIFHNNSGSQTGDISLSGISSQAYWLDGTTAKEWDISTFTAYAESESIELTSTLFKDGAWLGEDEVWIYQNGTTEEVTLRRDLLDLVTDTTVEYNGGTNSKDYTASSWTAFVEAYEDAKSVSGAGASTQTQIDDAEDALRVAYGNLELQAYYTVDVSQNFAGSATVGTNSFKDLSKEVQVVQESTVSIKFVAPTYYYIVSVMINGQVVASNPVLETDDNPWTFVGDYTFTSDNNTIDVTYAPNPTLSYQENGTTGGTVTFSGAINSNNQISYGYDATLNVTAPDLYYIQSVLVNGLPAYTNTNNDESITSFDDDIQNVTADTQVIITYAKRSTHTITIRNYDTTKGSLTYNNEVLNPGDVIEVLAGVNVTIVANPNAGYGVSTWGVDDTSYADMTEYTFSAISSNHKIDVQWLELQQIDITISARPGSAGKATATNGTLTASSDGTKTITVEQYNEITLTATVTDGAFVFVNWSIDGAYTIVSGSRSSETLVIKPGSTLKIVANYTQIYKKIYLKNVAGWSQPHIHYWGGSEGSSWPGVEMTYDSTSGYWVGYITEDSTGIQFNDGTNQNQHEPGLSTVSNLYNNGTNGGWQTAPYVEPGYYLQGKWNGKTFSGYDLQKFIDNGDGTYSFTVFVTSTTDGYIYVNPTNENSHFWNAATNGATGNPQTLTPLGAYTTTPNYVKVEIDTENYQAAYDVTFTFNPETGEFSWNKSAHVPTITVTITDGRGENSDDTTGDPNAANRVGNSYFDEDTVNSFTAHSTYSLAQVVAGSAVTFYTQVDSNSSGGYNYYVAGWVVNGTEFVSATSVGNGLYRGAYVFNEENMVVVPVYFHTNEWLAANGVETVTVYAVNKNNSIANWNNYMSVYTWYKVGETTKYEQFGAYTGQLMIPVTGLDGVYYTYIETSAPDGTKISGVTFSNHGDASNGYDVSPIVTYSHLQTYDYYEFISLLNDGKDNITFVLKNTNTTYNSDRVSTSTSVTLSQFTFEQYKDYSGLKTDIFGNDIESIDSTLVDSNALYVIQAGDKTVNDDTLAGQWYVKCYIYDAQGNYLGECYSYELHSDDSAIWDELSAYENQRAYISYEAMSVQRYDGEWYGDAQDVTVTINLAVKVALMGDDGKYVIDTEGELNLANYGNAYINGVQNVDVTRGTTVSLSAIPVTGFKFVGWYTADGTLFDKNINSSAMAAIGTHYVAVFEPLAEGLFYVNHYIYSGINADYYTPIVHGGNAQLYVGIQNVTQGTTTTLLLGNSAGLAATEGDKLLITIATDGIGADKFYAWYTDAVDKNGNPNFEEVGVDSLDNLAFSDPTCPYYMNGISTVVGSIDRVFFQFEYTVGGDEDEFVLNFYSDLRPVSDKTTLVYQYTDRYGNAKQYVVPYTLTDDEIKGFAGNNYEEFTPAYISSTDGSWVNTILANAPYVEDYFKDTTWKINSAMFDTLTFLLWATQPETMYTVTTTVVTKDHADVLVNSVPYNTVLDLDIRDLVPDASYTGFWYQDVNNNGTYEETVDIMLTYGPYYGYRVTQDMAVNYQYVDSADDYEFNVSLDAPVYGREQTTDSSGNNETDIVIIDYVINILTPYFYYLHPEFTPIYDGKEITDADWNKTLVTIESLKAAGYNVEYGVILEQVGTFDIRKDYAGDFAEAEKAAALKGYGTATDEELLKNFINSGSAKGWINGLNSTYGYKYDASGLEITNKNRVLFVLEHNNTEKNQNRFYNVYSYLTVTTPDNVTTTYISNVQTLNIYEEGIKDAVVENNTSFA